MLLQDFLAADPRSSEFGLHDERPDSLLYAIPSEVGTRFLQLMSSKALGVRQTMGDVALAVSWCRDTMRLTSMDFNCVLASVMKQLGILATSLRMVRREDVLVASDWLSIAVSLARVQIIARMGILSCAMDPLRHDYVAVLMRCELSDIAVHTLDGFSQRNSERCFA